MSEPTFIIGIDLGTTNCTMAYTQIDKPLVQQFGIAQVISKGHTSESFVLPSAVYFPLEEELKAKQTQINWDLGRKLCVGTYAQERGSELQGRLISSAKSWACHQGIDRREKILPMHVEAQDEKLSPVEALAELLKHMKEAWNFKFPQNPFHEQQILVTVPASFDPSARQLILEAAEAASYPELVLLEEPQAAFYSWLEEHKDNWRKILKVDDLVLVIDIGGGTTDFSLIEVGEEQGNLVLHRKAVGAHLLLGGDNLDLALAYLAKQKLEEAGHSIDEWQLQSLKDLSRTAKETLLSDNPPQHVELVIQGRGSKLIGNSLKTTITYEEATALLLEGFAPLVNPEEISQTEKQAGIQQIGLPYAKDPRISCQLAKFLSMTGDSSGNALENFVLPTAVLFNGGTLKSESLRQRLLDLLNHWAKLQNKPLIKELPGADLDFAVSRGAAVYGLARSGKAVRIRGGTSRSFFIGIEDSLPAVPGVARPLKALCVAPFGMEEGSELELNAEEFSLLLGEPATFRFFSRSTSALSDGKEPIMGTLVRDWKSELTELHPIETLLSDENDRKFVKVRLKTKVTELGVLELWCVADDNRKWKLEFDIRHKEEKCPI